MLAYTGRDRSRAYRLEVWVERMGARPVLEITVDEIYFALERLGSGPALIYMGRDAHGHPIHRMRASRKSPGTVNRFRDALSGVYNWAIKTRRLPKGTPTACSSSGCGAASSTRMSTCMPTRAPRRSTKR
jgi:hypothetical protein